MPTRYSDRAPWESANPAEREEDRRLRYLRSLYRKAPRVQGDLGPDPILQAAVLEERDRRAMPTEDRTYRMGTSTCRMPSAGPNPQNIPPRTPEGFNLDNFWDERPAGHDEYVNRCIRGLFYIPTPAFTPEPHIEVNQFQYENVLYISLDSQDDGSLTFALTSVEDKVWVGVALRPPQAPLTAEGGMVAGARLRKTTFGPLCVTPADVDAWPVIVRVLRTARRQGCVGGMDMKPPECCCRVEGHGHPWLTQERLDAFLGCALEHNYKALRKAKRDKVELNKNPTQHLQPDALPEPDVWVVVWKDAVGESCTVGAILPGRLFSRLAKLSQEAGKMYSACTPSWAYFSCHFPPIKPLVDTQTGLVNTLKNSMVSDHIFLTGHDSMEEALGAFDETVSAHRLEH